MVLKLSSGVELTLKNVLHVHDIRKNFVLGSILVNKGSMLVFESNKLVLTKFRKFIDRGYLARELFKIKVMVMCILTKNVANGDAFTFS